MQVLKLLCKGIFSSSYQPNEQHRAHQQQQLQHRETPRLRRMGPAHASREDHGALGHGRRRELLLQRQQRRHKRHRSMAPLTLVITHPWTTIRIRTTSMHPRAWAFHAE